MSGRGSGPGLFLLPGRRGRDLTVGPARPAVMGVLNLTPDSFSDGGRHMGREAALAAAKSLVADGADVLDLGAESTRPGARPVPPTEEMERLLPALEAIRDRFDLPISVDTRKPAVAARALEAGADWINDVQALRSPGMADVIATSGACVILMHMRGDPETMQLAPRYEDPVGEVLAFLEQRLEAAVRAGIREERILLDPGIGFGKRHHDNLALLAALPRFASLGRPLVLGISRKSVLGRLIEDAGLGRTEPGARDVPTAAATALLHGRGVSVHRVHAVRYAKEALAVARGLAAPFEDGAKGGRT